MGASRTPTNAPVRGPSGERRARWSCEARCLAPPSGCWRCWGACFGGVAALDSRLVSVTPPGSVEPESRGLGAGPVCGLKSTPPPQRGTCSTRKRGASSGGRHCRPAARKSGFRSKTGHPLDARERRGWDSNPRCPFRHAGFQDRCIQPLCHLSVGQILTPARPAWPVQRSHDRCLGVSGIPVI